MTKQEEKALKNMEIIRQMFSEIYEDGKIVGFQGSPYFEDWNNRMQIQVMNENLIFHLKEEIKKLELVIKKLEEGDKAARYHRIGPYNLPG